MVAAQTIYNESAMSMQSRQAIVLIVLASGAAAAQPAEQPFKFEVASIKPSDPTRPIAFKRSGYHIETTSTSLEWLITWAYDVHNDRLDGGPDWLNSVRYDVLANGPEDLGAARRNPLHTTPLQQMMQALLAERFKLAVHRETREMSRYVLTVARTGLKVTPGPRPETFGLNPFSFPGRGTLIGTQVTAEMLAKVLSGQLDRTVQDQTGIEGAFDFKLEWEPDPAIAGPPPPDAPARSSLFTSIQDQLGLKLEARKGPVEVLVIDHIDRTPTGN